MLIRTIWWYGLARWVREFIGPRESFVVGVVSDARTRAPLPGASISTQPTGRSIHGGGWVTEIGVLTDGEGRYHNLNIGTPGTFAVRASASGYRAETRTVTVGALDVVRVDFALAPV